MIVKHRSHKNYFTKLHVKIKCVTLCEIYEQPVLKKHTAGNVRLLKYVFKWYLNI